MDELLIKHASPTLAGIKTGNLFKVYLNNLNDLDEILTKYNDCFNLFKLYLYKVYETNSYALIYIYRLDLLEENLYNSQVLQFLQDLEYDISNIDTLLFSLKNRFEYIKRTPHEVGLFLGYPFEDVKEFIFNKGKNYKLSGCWKVYHNEKYCEEIFSNYKKCKSNNLKLFNMGFSLESLIYREL